MTKCRGFRIKLDPSRKPQVTPLLRVISTKLYSLLGLTYYVKVQYYHGIHLQTDA